jgi:tRNA pseudouridine55 synthase
VTIRCSAGTYVRSLARDLARRVGSAAHVSELRRTAIGAFSVEDAVAAGNVTLADRRPLRDALLRLPDVTEVPVSESVASLVRNGGALSADELGPGQGTLLVTHRDVPLAIGELREGRFNYGVVFPQQLRDARRLVDD